MTFKDLTVEYIKTIMASQRFVLFPNGIAVSIIQQENEDGYLIQAYKHSLKLNESIDLFTTDVREWNKIEFGKTIFTSKNTPEKFVDNTLNVLATVEWHE